MAINNSLTNRQQKTSFAAYLTQDAVKKQINSVLSGQEGQRFITSIMSAVQATPALAECLNSSIVSGALLGESLKLSPSPQLGHFYLVPYKDNNDGTTKAQFQIGYKGYIQLAIRSGQYKKLNVLAIKKGELVRFDPLNEEIVVNLIDDEERRESAETVGYYAMFEYTNGFRKVLYWSREKMKAHALRYSPGYKRDVQKGTKYTFWSKDFDAMATKTMLRQLISKWGIMSIEMQTAYTSDMGVIKQNGAGEFGVEYVESADVTETPKQIPEESSLAVQEQTAQKPADTAERPIPGAPDVSGVESALFG